MNRRINVESQTGRLRRGRNCLMFLNRNVHPIDKPSEGTDAHKMYVAAVEYSNFCETMGRTIYRKDMTDVIQEALGFSRQSIQTTLTNWMDDKDVQGKKKTRLFNFELNDELPNGNNIGTAITSIQHGELSSIAALVRMDVEKNRDRRYAARLRLS